MEAGRIIARQLYDYDNGRSYGLGVNLSKAVDSRGNLKYGVSIPVEYGFDERNRDILPTIGFGSDVAAETSVIGTLNRDVSRHVGCTDSKRASLDAKLPASDIADVMMAGYKAHVVRKDQITGVAAGDAPMVDPEYGDEEEEEFDDFAEFYRREEAPVPERRSVLFLTDTEDSDRDNATGSSTHPIWRADAPVLDGVSIGVLLAPHLIVIAPDYQPVMPHLTTVILNSIQDLISQNCCKIIIARQCQYIQ